MTEPAVIRPASLAGTEPAAEPTLRLRCLLLCYGIELVYLRVKITLKLLTLFSVFFVLLPGLGRQLPNLLVEPIRFLPGYTFDRFLGFLTVLLASSSVVANSALRFRGGVVGVT